MRLGANQSKIPVFWEFARAAAPVEFMVASGVSDLGQPSKSRDFEEATPNHTPWQFLAASDPHCDAATVPRAPFWFATRADKSRSRIERRGDGFKLLDGDGEKSGVTTIFP